MNKPVGVEHITSEGMTLRDYFAGQALAGMAVNYQELVSGLAKHKLAEDCYAVADAMIAKRRGE